MTSFKSRLTTRKRKINTFALVAMAIVVAGVCAVLRYDGASAANQITNLPAQPFALAYSASPADESSASAYVQNGSLLVTGRDNYQDQVFKDASAAGSSVLLYLDPLLNNTVGTYHDMLVNASACGPAVPKWPNLTAMANQWGYLNDFRVGGIEQSKLECVLEKMVSDNPHMAGWFVDDLGSRSWYPGYAPPGKPKSVVSQYDWSKWTTTNKQAYRDGAIALAQTFRKVADRHGLIFVVNGTWTGGTIASSGGGYPDATQSGNALADGGFIEHHDGEESFFVPYACSTQWASQSPVTNGKSIMMDMSLTASDMMTYADSGCIAYAANQADYDVPAAPWSAFHPTGLPTNTTGGFSTAADTVAPTVDITSPSSGATVYGNNVEISAQANDNTAVAGVQFQLNGANLGDVLSSAPYTYTWDTASVADGTYALTAIASDAAGNTATSSSVTVTVNNTNPPPVDTTAPTVSISAPVDGAVVGGDSVVVTADVSDDVGVSSLQFQLNGNNLGNEYSIGPYSYNLDTTTLGNGTYVLTAIARDAAGNVTTSAPVNITVNNPPAQTPYGGTARVITSTIQAEDFDNGGEGVAYHDTTSGNSGGKYRTSDVDIESNSTGYDVGYTVKGEWLEYTVNAVAGTYTLNLRVASQSTSTMNIMLDGTTLATVSIPNTGGWSKYKTVTVKNINISSGNNRILRIEYTGTPVDTDWVSFIKQ